VAEDDPEEAESSAGPETKDPAVLDALAGR